MSNTRENNLNVTNEKQMLGPLWEETAANIQMHCLKLQRGESDSVLIISYACLESAPPHRIYNSLNIPLSPSIPMAPILLPVPILFHKIITP